MFLTVPTSPLQVMAFVVLSLIFFLFLIRAASRRKRETGAKSDRRSQVGIILQSVGIAFAGFGTQRQTLESLSAAGLLGTAAVVLFMGGSIYLFAASSRALGKNWSLVARTRGDHELVRVGPYAWVRHPIYLGMLLFLFGLAAALGHWAQTVIAVPIFLVGTRIRTQAEDGLLERSFGDAFRDYRSSTPAIIPRLF
jgi:protein-S-isoprenylcysteine O-methyltransferase Ste14